MIIHHIFRVQSLSIRMNEHRGRGLSWITIYCVYFEKRSFNCCVALRYDIVQLEMYVTLY